MSEHDKATATGLVLRTCGHLAGLSLALAVAGAGLAGLSCRAGSSPGRWLLLALAAAILAVSGVLATWRLARLSGLGYCGIWDHHRAVRLLRGQVAALVLAAALAAVALGWI